MNKTVLELPERVGLTKETKAQLRWLKKIKKQSMAQIVKDLINQEYERKINDSNNNQ